MIPIKIFALFLLSTSMLAASGSTVERSAEKAQTTEQKNRTISAALDKFQDGEASSHEIGWFDLDGDGKQEAIVLITGPAWCGTGGCTLVVLKQDARSWRVVSRVPTSRSPVVLLNRTTNGWRDLAVVVQGGGNLNRRMAVLKFQEEGYVKHHEIAVQGGYRNLIP